jgi:hypothetical protein
MTAFRLPLPEGCFLTLFFALEPNSATPSTPTLGMQLCGNPSVGRFFFRILTNGKREIYEGVPAGMFADGGLHEIDVSISRKSYVITFYLDQKIMSKHSYAYDHGYYGSGEMPTFAIGKVSLGAAHIPWKNWR